MIIKPIDFTTDILNKEKCYVATIKKFYTIIYHTIIHLQLQQILVVVMHSFNQSIPFQCVWEM